MSTSPKMSVVRFSTPPRTSIPSTLVPPSRPVKPTRAEVEEATNEDLLILTDPLFQDFDLDMETYYERKALMIKKYPKQMIISFLEKQIKKREQISREIGAEIDRLVKKQARL